MSSPTISPELKKLALDFNKPNTYPRSPRELLAGYIIAARILDKCRAVLNDTAEEYNYDCPLDKIFFDFTGISADALKEFVATGASDEAVAEWIQQHSKVKEKMDIVKWNNEWRYKTIDKAPDFIQMYLEEDVFEQNPLARIIYFFDKLDMDENRL